jgi:6-methylsalicylate decarboxylase
MIDLHAHFVTESYVDAARAAGHATPDGMPNWPTWSVDAHLALMDAAGIERAVLSLSSPGVHLGDSVAARALARRMNAFAAGLPERFGHLAILPLPDVDGALAELSVAFDEGADGVVLLSNARGRYLGDPALDPLFAELDARRALVLLHPTSPVDTTAALGRPAPMVEFLFDSARSVADLLFADRLRRYPRIRWVLSHGGGVLPLLTHRMDLFGLMEGTVLDSAGQLAGCWVDTAGISDPESVPDRARLVYGSDFCFTPAFAVRAQAHALTDWRGRFAAGASALFREDATCP